MDKVMKHFRDVVTKDIGSRIKSGELDNSTPISLPPEIRIQLIDLISDSRNRDYANDRLVWFTLDRDYDYTYLDWPVAEYLGYDRLGVWSYPIVGKAVTRLKRNNTIQSIKVIGVKPKYWYLSVI